MSRSSRCACDLANPKNIYVPGQRAWVRLTVDRKPLIWQWYNRFLQLIETQEQDEQVDADLRMVTVD